MAGGADRGGAEDVVRQPVGDRAALRGRDERLAVDVGGAAEAACFLDLVCPECGRVTTDAGAPGCAACQTPAPS